jgi:aspartyl-tRNA(Asn)/glutamyl-tRNA(Gln) amidotransferase subunit C
MTSPSDPQVTEQDIARSASRARLSLSAASRLAFAEELTAVKKLLAALHPLPPAPPQQLHDEFAPPREDRVTPSLRRQEALRNAPDTDGTYVRVPPVL